MRFGDFLHQRLALLGWSQADFARKIGRSTSYVSQVKRGQKPPPRDDDLDEWAIVLRLSEAEQELWDDLAELERTPPRIRSRYLSLQAYCQALSQRVETDQRQPA